MTDIEALAKKVAPLTRDDLLILLVEECGEVVQAATKCLRFGYEHHQPGYGINCEVLGSEIGDLLGVVDALKPDPAIVEKSRAGKIAKATRIKAEIAADIYTLEMPDYGDVMTVEDFRAACISRGFIDYDGHGSPCKNGKRARMTISPSSVGSIPADATHIIWFNR